MNLKELAWAAGFFDGEGWIGAHHRQPTAKSGNRRWFVPRLAANVSQVDRRVLDRFRDAVGCGLVVGPYAARYENQRARYSWSAQNFNEVQAMVAMLWRFLSPVKRAQASAALKAVADGRLKSAENLAVKMARTAAPHPCRKGLHVLPGAVRQCKECAVATRRAWHAKHPDRQRAYDLKRKKCA